MEKMYISGAITGTDDYLKRFGKAEKKWKKEGFEVINPAKANSHMPSSTTYREYMLLSLAMLSMCNVIYMLQGWEESEGAKIELDYAMRNKKTVIIEGDREWAY